MTTEVRAGAAVVAGSEPDRRTGPELRLSEVVVGGAAVFAALLAWASLGLAHLGRHSAFGAVVLALLGTAVLVRLCRGARVTVDRRGLAGVLAVGAVAAFLSFPGFGYGVTDKDPGGYVAHAVAIARTGSYSFDDPALQRVAGVEYKSPGARFPGIWVRDAQRGLIVPQFYHLWPSLLATAYDVGGFGGLVATTPLLAVLAAMLMTVLVRRALGGPAGEVAGVLAGLLLATNLLQVWQSKYPTTEILSELLFLGALLGVVLAVSTGWRVAAGLAGLLVGIGYLNRPDGLLLILVSAAAGAALVAVRRWDSRAWWYAGGLAAVLPHGFYQAYDAALAYTRGNNVPGLTKVLAVVLGALAAGVLARFLLEPLVDLLLRLAANRRAQFVAGFLVCAVAAVLLVVGFLRPRLFGPDYFQAGSRTYRSYDEHILRRLSWFFTLPGLAVMGLGLAVVALRRWRAELWALVLPTLLIFPVYATTSRNSSRLMWWNRRYVPTVLPGVVVLIALALGVALTLGVPRYRLALRGAALAVVAFLLVTFLGQSLPLRDHDEFGGSFAITAEIAALAGDRRGVYLWQPCDGCTPEPGLLFAAAVWLERDQLSALVPREAGKRAAYVDSFRRAFPGQPLFVVWRGGNRPEGLAAVPLRRVRSWHTSLPVWRESDTERPASAIRLGVDFTVWRVA